MGKQYLSAGVTWQAHPLLPVNAFVICNLSDGSLMLSPTAEYNIKEDEVEKNFIRVGFTGKVRGLDPVTQENIRLGQVLIYEQNDSLHKS